MALIYIQGGPEPFAGQAYDSDLLMNYEPFVQVQDQYRWTSQTISSTKDPNKVAQVWRHVSLGDADTVGTSPIPSAAENTNSLASEETTREVETETARAVSSPPATAESATSGSSGEERASFPNAFVASQVQREAEASVRLDGETQTFEADYTGPSVPVDAEDDGDLPDGEQLFLRRKRLKLTVQEVADGLGMARSRVDAIEKGTAKRGNVAGDLRAVHEFLQQREGGAPEAPRD